MASTYAPLTAGSSAQAAPTARRYRREASLGPRCPHCAGPLVFGEGCNVCPICGYSSCSI